MFLYFDIVLLHLDIHSSSTPSWSFTTVIIFLYFDIVLLHLDILFYTLMSIYYRDNFFLPWYSLTTPWYSF